MDTLKRLIYHEKQEQGSMLCAQHALNALLQGNYFSASDLSSLASDLDDLEGSYRNRDVAATQSVNMDDSGFFSIQVVERALQVWGLGLVPWSSGELAAFHRNPDTQEAFILNLDQHWFTIRRFGSPDGHKHWFNLNSFLESPEHVRRTYLSMMLDESEIEGYSVFAVRPLPESIGISLPVCEADEVASTIPEADLLPDGYAPHPLISPSGGAATVGLSGFEDEDLELQRVLQASLVHTSSTSSAPRTDPVAPPMIPGPGPSTFAESARRGFDAALEEHEQIQEGLEIPSVGAQRYRTRAEEDEEEMIRRAMEESLRSSNHIVEDEDDGEYNDDEIDDDNDAYFDDDDDENMAPISPSRVLNPAAPQIQTSTTPTPSVPLGALNHGPSRVIDDEDAELQAALRASLEGLPEGFSVPETPPRRLIHTSTTTASPQTADVSRGVEDEEREVQSPEPAAAEKPDIDEIRRRRLARFGA
ncbi:hypothetical protein BS47DRAFT_1387314 [Hydnum rufescens UP504]|uniref:ubiquitinyl hydrolase 1 n=1 Tax=Hydnum rufescens UP504 TaxID=1448309 RepID=A0A9P6E1X8_9AGAM|nr:hypothetical protein BS47DRAFT_1387314 [Hydnum rufescens UP504]